MFLLFDYSFRPSDVTRADALAWARETGVVSGDELMLSSAPWPTRDAWCHARCDWTLARLEGLPPDTRTVLVNHWPLRYDLARAPRVPRFSLWSGTDRTEDWGERYRARAVISGHLHLRSTLWRRGVRYDEVSLGYPRDWRQERGIALVPAAGAARLRRRSRSIRTGTRSLSRSNFCTSGHRRLISFRVDAETEGAAPDAPLPDATRRSRRAESDHLALAY